VSKLIRYGGIAASDGLTTRWQYDDDQTDAAGIAADTDEAEENITFDRMSEEDLLAGIEGLVAPEKSDDY
jgi:hypothetical protein